MVIFFQFFPLGNHEKKVAGLIDLPPHFKMFDVPDNNQLTKEKVALGKKLFFDPILSNNKTLACASCHKPASAFADNIAISVGDKGATGNRNTPTIVNAAYGKHFLAEGGVPTLEEQVMVPITGEDEMNADLKEVVYRLRSDSAYQILFKKAYGKEPDLNTLVKALASFERTLISGNSKFDRYRFQNDNSALNESEKRGMEIFFSKKAKCSSCHSGVLFTSGGFENNGLHEHYEDIGRARLTDKEEDKGKFKVPTLRNIALTAPYMHDGSLKTLKDVIEHYNKGGEDNPNKSKKIRPLNLTVQEKTDLENFLGTLTDYQFLNKELTANN